MAPQAYGALGMDRSNEDPDSASSQFFFLKWLQALVAPGDIYNNTLSLRVLVPLITCYGLCRHFIFHR